MTTRAIRCTPALAVAALAAAVLSACGYALAGRGSFLPPHIQTIGIPLFGNNTSVFDAEQLLTARVRQEFIARGRYKIIPETAGADAVLRGEIASITLTPSGFNADNQATRYVVQVAMRIDFRDVKADKVLWANPSLVYREEFEIVSIAGGTLDPNAFFGQGGNALERMAGEFARTVVSSLLEGF